MTDCFRIQGKNGGSASASPSAAIALDGTNALAQQQYRIVTNNFIRIEFGGSSVVVSDTSPEFAPGEVYILRENETYYSVQSISGTANYSINVGLIINIYPMT